MKTASSVVKVSGPAADEIARLRRENEAFVQAPGLDMADVEVVHRAVHKFR